MTMISNPSYHFRKAFEHHMYIPFPTSALAGRMGIETMSITGGFKKLEVT
jgi:hypothetical protein